MTRSLRNAETRTPDDSYVKAVALIESGRLGDALPLLHEVIQRSYPGHQGQATRAKALLQRGLVFEALGDDSNALSDFGTLLALSQGSEDEVREISAWALNRKATLLQRLTRLPEALSVFSELEARFKDDSSVAVKRVVSAGYVLMAGVLAELGEDGEVARVIDRLVEQFGRESDQEIDLNVTRGLMSKALARHRQERIDDAASSYDEILTRVRRRPDQSSSIELLEQAAWALANKTSLLVDVGEYSQALSNGENALAWFSDVSTPSIDAAVASALINRGRAYDALGQTETGIAAYDQVVDLYASSPEPELRAPVSTALLNKAAILREVGRTGEAAEAYAEVATRFGDASESGVRENLARALYFEGEVLAELGRPDEALRTLDNMISRFEKVEDDVIAHAVASARDFRANLLGRFD